MRDEVVIKFALNCKRMQNGNKRQPDGLWLTSFYAGIRQSHGGQVNGQLSPVKAKQTGHT